YEQSIHFFPCRWISRSHGKRASTLCPEAVDSFEDSCLQRRSIKPNPVGHLARANRGGALTLRMELAGRCLHEPGRGHAGRGPVSPLAGQGSLSESCLNPAPAPSWLSYHCLLASEPAGSGVAVASPARRGAGVPLDPSRSKGFGRHLKPLPRRAEDAGKRPVQKVVAGNGIEVMSGNLPDG